jgi:hypothetical protein
MRGHDISSQENNAVFGEITAWNVFDADGYNAMGYHRDDYVAIGQLPAE